MCPLFLSVHLYVFVWVFVKEAVILPTSLLWREITAKADLTLTISLNPVRPAVREIDRDRVGADILTGWALFPWLQIRRLRPDMTTEQEVGLCMGWRWLEGKICTLLSSRMLRLSCFKWETDMAGRDKKTESAVKVQGRWCYSSTQPGDIAAEIRSWDLMTEETSQSGSQERMWLVLKRLAISLNWRRAA